LRDAREGGESRDASSAYSSLNAITGASNTEPTFVSDTSSNDGFDWLSAVIGAGAAMAVIALGSAAFQFGRRTAPSTSTS
jgi:hypothetical protein